MDSMDFNQRKSPRIPKYDYSSAQYYFITICSHEKRCIFGKPGELNWLGQCAETCLLMIQQLNPDIRVDQYVIMPNHIHVIFDLQNCRKGMDLSVVIGQYKMSVTKKIREQIPNFQVWQRSFHDHIIRNQKSYEKIWSYIEGNPSKWEEDCFYISAQQNESEREGH
jgi:REP element-mobilizing transposase RayT